MSSPIEAYMLYNRELAVIFIVGLNPSLDECPQIRVTGNSGAPEVASLSLFNFFFIEEIEQLMINVIRLRFLKMGRQITLEDVLFDSDVKSIEECVREVRLCNKRQKPLLNIRRSDLPKLLQTPEESN